MAGTTAESWIGQPIELWLELGNGRLVNGTLEGVDDKGVVVLQSLEVGVRPVFYAWRLVAWMHPTEGRERAEGYLKAPVDVPPQGPTPPEVEGQPAPPEVPEIPPRRREEEP
jgi:small nuclear ribonucleoprotein (snRNP)-like protein